MEPKSGFTEAKVKNISRNKGHILNASIDSTSKDRVLEEITDKCLKNTFIKPLFIITAYSENILECAKDADLKTAMDKADLVVPDGVSVVAAADYLSQRSGNTIADLCLGLKIGKHILQGKYGKRQVVGVELAKTLLKQGGEKGWRIFLLGGLDKVAEKVAKMMRRDFPGIKIEWDEGYGNIKSQINDSQITNRVLTKIKVFKPDILLVAFGRFRQEKWIAGNLDKLETKVVMGVGSAFDELAAVGPWATPTPAWVSGMGLKWLWRAFKSPGHLKRAWNAFPVFAWKVFRSR